MSTFNAGVLCRKLASFFHAVSIYLLLPLFSFLFRAQRDFRPLQKNGRERAVLEAEAESKAEKDIEFGSDNDSGKAENTRLMFKFPTFQEFSRIQGGKGNLSSTEVVPSVSEYKFACLGQETLSVKEINGDKIGEDGEVFLDRKLGSQDKAKVLVGSDGRGDRKTETMELTEKSGKKALSDEGEEEFEGSQEFLDESHFCSDNGFLSDADFGGEVEFDGENEKLGLEVQKLEEHKLENPIGCNSEFLSEKDFNEKSEQRNDTEFEKAGDESGKLRPKDASMLDSGDANKLESLWEHQELIEQLKMELRKVRATGLPTILEESESPKITDDLKPWKIDENFHYEDCMDELHKFYKSYIEMMRKFDILNYQKMYAMGFLQLKDPFQSASKQKPSAPSLKFLVSRNLWLFRHKSHGSDPIKKFINELQGDLEVVYVGQMCLSWEFLHWQYEKALDLWNSDPHGIHQYNEIAGEFQQFQVLVQRFVEDEPFQGPRVQSYVRSRCVLRNLLQVPAIREDNLRDKKAAGKGDGDGYTITSDMLVETVEESIRILWQFVRSDKDCIIVANNGHKKMRPLHSPEDHKLLAEVRKVLRKKDRKLRDILRSEKCILRKFHHSREDDSDQVLYFFAQVDMKLVCRVLNMAKITRDQLVWCQNKLSRISFVNRKINVEPAFLLFPC